MMNDNNPFHEACIKTPKGERQARAQEWKAHPSFPGVWMKNLIVGEDTGGQLSCHLVRVEKGCAIGLHTHEGSLELHEVLAGNGLCKLDSGETAYRAGVCMVIPAGQRHAVEAHGEDLHLMAKFTPALV